MKSLALIFNRKIDFTRISLFLLVFSIPFESYINWNIGFTLKPAQVFALTTFIAMLLSKEKVFGSFKEHAPFLFILFAAGISLINAPSELIFKNPHGSLRMIMNLSVLYFIAWTISLNIKDVNTFKGIFIMFILAVFFSVLYELIRNFDPISHVAIGGFGEKTSNFFWLSTGYLRLSPINSNPNNYGYILFIALTFILFLSINNEYIEKKYFSNLLPIFFVTCFYGFILTFSRESWISFLISSFIILWYAKNKKLLKILGDCKRSDTNLEWCYGSKVF